jgi:hypothetical protein
MTQPLLPWGPLNKLEALQMHEEKYMLRDKYPFMNHVDHRAIVRALQKVRHSLHLRQCAPCVVSWRPGLGYP